MIERVIVAGGGTGGHLFPGVAVVEELRRRNPDVDVLFVGTERGIESRVLPNMGERLEPLRVLPLKGRRLPELVKSLTLLPNALYHASKVVRRHKADLVIGVGGYASGPVLLAAALQGVPTALLEQNAKVGLTNRMLADYVGRAYVTFPETAGSFPEEAVRVPGNPIRRAFVDAARLAVADPEGFEARANTVLVLGGSQGAQAINRVLPKAIAQLDLRKRGLRIVHQTGESMRAEVEAAYRELGFSVRSSTRGDEGAYPQAGAIVDVVSFIDDMATAYASASIVVARAGATTVAELCAIGCPSVLIPYPHAADDHQTKNAHALAETGAAICLDEDSLSDVTLVPEMERLLSDTPLRKRMAEAARAQGRPDAAAAIVDDLLEWLKGPVTTVADGHAAPASGNETQNPESSSDELRSMGAYFPVMRSADRRSRSSVPANRRPLLVGWGE